MGQPMRHRRRMPLRGARKISASVLATAVAVSGTLGASLVMAPAASAAAENGYVFNDTWQLVAPGSAATDNTLPNQRSAATYSATSRLPMRTGNIGIRMQVKESDATVKGTNYLDSVNNQDYWKANSSTFLGSPTVANLSGVALETNPSNCGAFDSAAKVDFNGVCKDTSEVTISFDKAVTDPILDVSGLGGYAGTWARDSTNVPYSYRGGFLQQQWNLLTQGVTLQAPAGTNPSNLTITSDSFKPSSRNANGTCYSVTQDFAGQTNSTPRTAPGACGSVLLRGTFDSVTFRIDHDVAPFTAFSSAEYGTGSDWFASDRKMTDGINGLNSTYGESPTLPNNTWKVQNDQAHFSVRLPQTGAIGDKVWNDANGNGIQDAGEAGIAGVKVELLDENGQPVLDTDGNPITTTTDANGAYRFEDLPLGKYTVRFSGAPAGMSPTVQAAGDDRSKDSDINSSGETGVIDLNSDTPEQDDIDAGFTAGPAATDDESLNNDQGTAVKVPVLSNDKGDLDPSTVKLKDPNGNPVDSLTVAGEGKWTVDPKTGDITFTPEAGFTKNPTPVNYTVKDRNGKETGAKVTVTYKPEATDDESLNNKQGTTVTVPTLKNDKGDLDPSTVKIKDKDGNPVDSLTVAGEGKWTVDPKTGDITFAPEAGFTGNPTPVDYTVKDHAGNETGAKVTVTYVEMPVAADDQSLNNDQGTTVTVPTLKNDKGDLDPSTVKLKDPNGNPVDSLTVAGEGKWTVDPKTGDITFTPEAGFTKNPTPVNYTVKDTNGNETGAKVTVTYKPEATDDESLNNAQGTTVKVPVLGNDKGDLDPSTVKIKDKDGNPVDSLTVPGEGKWTVDPKTGDITFAPEAGFTGNPTPVNYTVKDKNGQETGAKVTVTYKPEATDDESLNNDQGTAVKVPVLSNDKGDLDPSTVKIKDKDGNPVDSLTVAGEGKWTVDPKTGDITFTPEAGFTKNPTLVNYTVKDHAGNETGAKVTVTYKPEATDDESLNNKQGTTVTVPTLKNDKGDLDPSTVKIKDKDGNPVDSLTVAGEGKWTVDPKTGDITFTPEKGFTGNPTPVNYTVKDRNGNETGAKVTITYVAQEPSHPGTPGSPVHPPKPGQPAPGNPADPGNPAPGGDLAYTGANLSMGTIAAGALLFLGGAALLIFRRRRQH